MSRVPPTTSGRARLWNGTIPGTFEPGYLEQPIVEHPVPAAVRRAVHGPDGGLELHTLRMGACNLILGHEPMGPEHELRWHLSISTPHRHPSWDEIKTARYRLLGPDTSMAMLLPPVEFYVNVPAQDHVFQVWEIADAAAPWEPQS
jgi:hypothetical protein